MKAIGILGAGTWGMALARMLANSGHQVVVWSALEKEIQELTRTHINPNLPEMIIPESVKFTKDIYEACESKDICPKRQSKLFSGERKPRPYD